MIKAPAILCSALLLICMQGCVCNKSEVHSKSSEPEINERLEESFARPMARQDRLLASMGLVDPRHLFLAIMESEDNASIALMLTRPGCHRWPLKADSVLVLSFDADGTLIAHERLMLGNGVTLEKTNDGTDGVHAIYVLDNQGNQRSYTRVFESDFDKNTP